MERLAIVLPVSIVSVAAGYALGSSWLTFALISAGCLAAMIYVGRKHGVSHTGALSPSIFDRYAPRVALSIALLLPFVMALANSLVARMDGASIEPFLWIALAGAGFSAVITLLIPDSWTRKKVLK
ncbi:hypothetical protein [Parerythrobacter lacustris]|uniref:hypothetical protein n=1 Tax=Parerythrobacter lacustris TaxID=2969984 RepID=UPI00214C01ED|nr:hypothetical protein [Parerythrobacter lacustris]